MTSIEKQKTFVSYSSGPKFKSNIIAPTFKSYIPLDRKFKIEDLFEFKRKDGDLFLSFVCLFFVCMYTVPVFHTFRADIESRVYVHCA